MVSPAENVEEDNIKFPPDPGGCTRPVLTSVDALLRVFSTVEQPT